MADKENYGSYSSFSGKINDEMQMAFDEALEGFTGIHYEPVAVSMQVVAGINYVFFCNATVVYPGAASRPILMHIFQPLDGRPSVTHIERI